VQGAAGRAYHVRCADQNGYPGLRLGATVWSQQLSPAQILEVTADASGIGRFYLSSTGQLSAGRVECVRLEVGELFTGEACIRQFGAFFETLGNCVY
jgi:hypothetical protein